MRFFLIIVFTLFPSVVFGGVGDVYYCVGKTYLKVKNFKVIKYKPQIFTFKRTSEGLFFDSKNHYFKKAKLKKKIYDNGGELFDYSLDGNNVFTFQEGVFNFSDVSYKTIINKSGTCSIF